MGVAEIILIVFSASVVIGVIISSVIRKKQGKCSGGCGGDCSHCRSCVHEEPRENTLYH